MSLPQQKFREIVFQLLYSRNMSHANEEDMIALLMAELSVTKKSVKAAQERMLAILSKQQEIDSMISGASKSYEFERIPSVERNIIRLGVFELLFDDEIPPKVSISEAIRLARKFASPESATFVNAVLDNLYKTSLGEPVAPSILNEAVKALDLSEQIAKEAAVDQPISIEKDPED